ncbi:hypothetical protein V8E54_011661 [Elaphomyces granulatus]
MANHRQVFQVKINRSASCRNLYARNLYQGEPSVNYGSQQETVKKLSAFLANTRNLTLYARGMELMAAMELLKTHIHAQHLSSPWLVGGSVPGRPG